MIKVCHLSSVHPAFDTRVFYKECKSLAESGYDVTLIARHDTFEEVEGVRVVPFRLWKSRIKRILFSPLRMFRLALKQRAHIYHFHDPELMVVGVMLKLWRKKVIYDVHEDVPKQILDKYWIKGLWLRKTLAFVTGIFETCCALFFDRIITATPDIAVNFNPRKTTAVRNLPLLKLMDTDLEADIEKQKPVVIYAGILSEPRGIKEIVDAMATIGDKAELWLLGKWQTEDYFRRCRESGGWKHTRFFGQKTQAEAYAYMKIADVGVVNFFPKANHVRALPNKIFEYMAVSLPMVISNFPYWKENFRDCALFADPQDPGDIAGQIERFLDDGRLRRQKGSGGRAAIESEYSWEREKDVLLDLYGQLSGQTKGTKGEN